MRWDFSRPYLIAHGPDCYCQHLGREKKCRSAYACRPVPCRSDDRSRDKRIWLDFKNQIINPSIGDPEWPRCLEVEAKAAQSIEEEDQDVAS